MTKMIRSRWQFNAQMTRPIPDHHMAGPIEWSYHEENVERHGDPCETINIGAELLRFSDDTAKVIEDYFRPTTFGIADGDCLLMRCENDQVSLMVYLYRHGKEIDIGLRRDMEELGWSEVCDRLDAKLEKQRSQTQ